MKLLILMVWILIAFSILIVPVFSPLISWGTTWFETIPTSFIIIEKIESVLPDDYYVEQVGWFTASRHGDWLEYYVVVRSNKEPDEWTNDFTFYNTKTGEIQYDFSGVASNR